MNHAIIAPVDLATNITTETVIEELEAISDEFNRKLGKLTKAQHITALDGAANFYGVDATLIVLTIIDQMFANVNYDAAFFTYGITNRIDNEIARMQ